MRVHFVVHHARSRAAGASGATQALGAALTRHGCEVSYFHFDDAFERRASGRELSRMVRFPWRVASHLACIAREVDVVDATTGDAWVWAMRRGRSPAALVTRSHGLEHVMDADLRARARRGEATLSRKYPLYHGGFRLWEVRRSLATADAQVFLNDTDRAYAIEHFGLPTASAVVVPNGVQDTLLDHEVPVRGARDGPLALAFIGSWIPRKGISAVMEGASLLHARGVPFTLRLFGTGLDEHAVRGMFADDVRPYVTVTPVYAPDDLQRLLQDADVLLHPSWTEGFSLALVEGMALGLVPVATRSGGAASIVLDGVTGLTLADASGEALASAVTKLARDPVLCARLAVGARQQVQSFRWSSIAARTLDVYRAAIHRRHIGLA